MKKSIKYLLVAVAVLALGVVGLLAYVKTALPDVGEPETITIESREELIERGRYLANSVMVCMDCHSTRDWSKFSGPLVEGTLGQGGEQRGLKPGPHPVAGLPQEVLPPDWVGHRARSRFLALAAELAPPAGVYVDRALTGRLTGHER